MKKRTFFVPAYGKGIYEEFTYPDPTKVEQWVSLELEDGTIVRIKTIITSVIKFSIGLEGSGPFVYHVETQNVVKTFPPEEELPYYPNAPNSEKISS